MTPATIARIETQFHLPPERTGVQGDFHYQSKETPNGLSGVSRHELRPDIYPSETDRRRA